MRLTKIRMNWKSVAIVATLFTLCFLSAGPHLVSAYYRWRSAQMLRRGNLCDARDLYAYSMQRREGALFATRADLARDYWAIGNMYYQERQYWAANECYTQALSYANENIVAPVFWKRLDEIFGSLAAAEIGYKRLLETRIHSFGGEDPEVAAARYGLGRIYQRQSRYREAALVYQETLRIWERTLGSKNLNIAHALKSLGGVQIELCEYAAAESTLTQAVRIYESAEDSVVRGWAQGPLSNLGSLYCTLGRFTDAEKVLLRALLIQPYDRFTLDDLARVYIERHRLSEADAAYRQSLNLRLETLGPAHHEISWSLCGLAEVRFLQRDYQEAEQYYRKAERISRHALGPQSLDVAACQLGCARALHAQSQLQAAADCYDSALRALTKSIGDQHPLVADCLLWQTLLYCDTRSPSLACETARRAYHIRLQLFNDLFPVLSEPSARLYAKDLRLAAGLYTHCLLALQGTSGQNTRELASTIMSVKGVVTDGMLTRRRHWELTQDDDVDRLRDSLRTTQNMLAQFYQELHGHNGDRSLSARLTQLAETKNRLESELARKSDNYESETVSNGVNIEQVWNKLPEDCALLDFYRYDYPEIGGDSHAAYVALVYTRDRRVHCVNLAPAQQIDSLVQMYRSYFEPPVVIDPESCQKTAARLYNAVCGPIDSMISPCENLVIIPDGALGLISFATLRTRSNDYLIERHSIHYLTSVRDMIVSGPEVNPGRGLLAVSDPLAQCTASGRDLNSLPIRVADLAGSARETRRIAAQWTKEHGESVTLLSDKNAKERSFKQHCRGKRVVHVATHGYWAPEDINRSSEGAQPDAMEEVSTICPLLHTGLVMAESCNRDDRSDSLSDEDGILYAEEIASLDMRGTQLVVLTSCNSGMGEIEPGEGIFGLRRAFQLAGAGTIVSALWSVPDDATADLIGAVYEHEGNDISAALREASLKMIADTRRRHLPDQPLSWGAFVVYGG